MSTEPWMLTPFYGSELRQALDFAVGINVVELPGRSRPILLIKAAKEVILTVQVRRAFRIYAVGIPWGNETTVGVASTFFDDADQPLALYTPLFADSFSELLRGRLAEGEFDVHFFDELNYELLGYTTVVKRPPEVASLLRRAKLLPYGKDLARAALERLSAFMGVRDSNDDDSAISIELRTPIFPENLFIQDLRPRIAAATDGKGFRHTTLVREEPGLLQELDIVALLRRTFPSEQLFHGPKRITDGEEIADVLLYGASHVLLLQAKDSPNAERVLNNPLSRKRSTTLKSLKKACRQAAGAVRYVRARSAIEMLVNGKNVTLPTEGKQLFSLLVLKELFDFDYDEYSPLLQSLARDTGVPCVALDYPELSRYTANLLGEGAFFEALYRVFDFGMEHGAFPRLRFWPPGS